MSNHLEILDVSGAHITQLEMQTPLFVSYAMNSLRAAEPLIFQNRVKALVKAGEIFATQTINGCTREYYEHAVSRISGIPISVVRTATQTLKQRMSNILEIIEHARPQGTIYDWHDPTLTNGRALWTRRGNVLSVHAVGNHPGTHSIWPEALLLGYRIAIRPSRREPLTPLRLLTALHAAGFDTKQVIALPTENSAAEIMFQSADFAYGGDEIIRKNATHPKVLALKPGRSKILLTRDVSWENHIDTIYDSIVHHAGSGCVNTTAILIEGDPSPLAEALTSRMRKLPDYLPEDERAILPVQSIESAKRLSQFLLQKGAGTHAWLGGNDIIGDLGDGSAVLRPALHQLDDPLSAQLGIELPFPCVWIAPWSPADGIAPLKNSLVVTAYTQDATLIESLIHEPSISNFFLGDVPTYWTDIGMPHDGYLAEFLMRSKTVKNSYN